MEVDELKDGFFVSLEPVRRDLAWTVAQDVIDDDDAQNRYDSVEDAYAGILGEAAVVKWLEAVDDFADAHSSGCYEYDLDYHSLRPSKREHLKLEVKTRNRAQTDGRDLLVRDRPEAHYDADFVVQVILAESKEWAKVTGFTDAETAYSAAWFENAQSHPTRIVQREALTPAADLVA